MSEITKLYENAGVDYEERYNNCTLNKEGECKLKCSCDICKYSEERYIYPSFTAEKQIELIKWLAIKGDFAYTVDIAKNTDAYWTIYFDDSRWTAEEFEETFAGLINQLWQDLTEEEKQQVKGILE